MTLDEYVAYDALGLAELVKKGDVTPQELVELARKAANKVNPQLNAIVEMFDTPVHQKPLPVTEIFAGVPCFKKDLGAALLGCGYECGSRLMRGVRMPLTDDFMGRMLQSGLQVMGRATCSEFAVSTTTETLAHGATRNPWNTDFSVGGSSGGSAALVAAGVVPLAHTNDGGGSTRIPASICGNIGLKTTRGLIGNAPANNELTLPLVSEGCNSRSVRDTAAFLDAVAKFSVGDAVYKGVQWHNSFLANLAKAPQRYRIAYTCATGNNSLMDGVIKSELERVAQLLASLGHTVVEFTPPVLADEKYWQHYVTLICTCLYMQIDFCVTLLGRRASLEMLELVTLQIYETGVQITAKQQMLAWNYFNQAGRSLGKFFQHYDFILTPTVSQATAPIGSHLAANSSLPLDAWLSSVYHYVPHTPLANAVGIPAISVPVATGPGGLPLGMQFMGAMGAESSLLDIAQQLEIASPWAQKTPGIFAGG